MSSEEHDKWLSAFFVARDQLGDAIVELAERRIARLGGEGLEALAAAFELGPNAPREDLVYAYAGMLAEEARRVAERKHYLLRYFARAVIFDDLVLLYVAADLAELLFAPEVALASVLTAVEMAERYGAIKVAEEAKSLVVETARRVALRKARRDKWPLVEAAARAEVRKEGGVFVVIDGGELIGRIVEGVDKMITELADLRIELPSLRMKSGIELGRQIVDAVRIAGIEQIEMMAFALAFVMEKYLIARFGKIVNRIIKDMWYGVADDIYV